MPRDDVVQRPDSFQLRHIQTRGVGGLKDEAKFDLVGWIEGAPIEPGRRLAGAWRQGKPGLALKIKQLSDRGIPPRIRSLAPRRLADSSSTAWTMRNP